MPRPRLSSALATAALLLAAPVAAQAEEIVPPSNSAAIQYTETIPTSHGQKDAEGKKEKVKPAKVLGHKNAQKLEKQGKQGREVAELAAETAPAPIASSGSGSPPGHKSGSGSQKQEKETAAGGGGTGKGSGGSGGGGTPAASDDAGSPAPQAHGSSAFGEIAGQATGTSSGQLGLLLPLVILGAVAWAAAYFWRQRRRIA